MPCFNIQRHQSLERYSSVVGVVWKQYFIVSSGFATREPPKPPKALFSIFLPRRWKAAVAVAVDLMERAVVVRLFDHLL